jgi:DNA-binding transcriptional ArsR family regulator
MQPIRLKIVKLLKQSKEPLYIEQIAEKVGEDRRSVSFHLATLAENGFVEGDFEIIRSSTKNPGTGKAGKFYKLTPKVDEVLQKVGRVLE